MYLEPCIDWLVTYWEPCTEIPLLVTACCDNSGFSGVVTLNSFDGVFALELFPIHKQITISTLFSTAFNLVGDLFMLPCVLYVN